MTKIQWVLRNCRFAQTQTLPAVQAPANPFEEFGRSSDMNFLLGPNGQEVHVPGMSHSGEAQKILAQRGQQIDPELALETLIKEGWMRISGFMVEYMPVAGWKERLKAFIQRHNDYYKNEPYLELDNRAKGFSRQAPMSSFIKEEYNPESEAAQRADEMARWRR